MSDLSFRNIDAEPTDQVETWPYEGLVAAIERGSLSDWRRIVAAIRRAPWGSVVRSVQDYAAYGEERAVVELLLEAIRRAQVGAEDAERREVAARVAEAIRTARMPASRFAAEVGTSPSRLSTYRTGAVAPSAPMLLRIEREAARLGAGLPGSVRPAPNLE